MVLNSPPFLFRHLFQEVDGGQLFHSIVDQSLFPFLSLEWGSFPAK